MGNVKWKGLIGKERRYNIIYKEQGLDVIHWEVIPLKKDEAISIKIISSNYPSTIQGLRIAVDNGDGMFEYNGETKKEIHIWENELGDEKAVISMKSDGLLGFYNTFYEPPSSNPAIPYGYRSLMAFSGMLLEKLDEDKYLYRCHGMEKTSDFDCMVFELEILRQ